MRLVFLVVLAAATALAGPIGDLYNTGDPNGIWTVDGAPTFVTDTASYPFPHWKTDARASWISPQRSYAEDIPADLNDLDFVFSTKFTLPDNVLDAFILMQTATDNALIDVRLNGSSLGYPTTMMLLFGNTAPTAVIAAGSGFANGLGEELAILSGFRPGVNTLDFHVRNSATNSASAGNPTGIIVAFESDMQLSDVSTPEPGTWLTAAAGVALLALRSRKRRS